MNMKALAASLAALTSALPSGADTLRCDAPLVTAEARTPELARATCGAVSEALEALGRCGLTMMQPLLVTVLAAPEHPVHGVCLGYYDSHSRCISVAEPARYTALLPAGDARRNLPPDRLFRGLVAHEVAHAVIAQLPGGTKVAPEHHEFIAAVFEMEVYGPESRAALLAADPVRAEGSRDMVNMGIYALAPRVFGNNAWALYQAEPDGCALVRGIVSGERALGFR